MSTTFSLASHLSIDGLVSRLTPLLARATAANTPRDHSIVVLREVPFDPPPCPGDDHQEFQEYIRQVALSAPVFDVRADLNGPEDLKQYFLNHQAQTPNDFSFDGVQFACQLCTGMNEPLPPQLNVAHGTGGTQQQSQIIGGTQDQIAAAAAALQQAKSGSTVMTPSAQLLSAVLMPEFTSHGYKILRGPLQVFEHCQSPDHLAARHHHILQGTCTITINGQPMFLDRTHSFFPERVFGPGVLLWDEGLGAFLAPDGTGAVSIQQGGQYRLARLAMPIVNGSALEAPLVKRGLPTKAGNLSKGGIAATTPRFRVEAHFARRPATGHTVLADETASPQELTALKERLHVPSAEMPSRANMRALRYDQRCKADVRTLARVLRQRAKATGGPPQQQRLSTTRMMRLGATPLLDEEQQHLGEEDETKGQEKKKNFIGRNSLAYCRSPVVRIRMTQPRVPPSVQAKCLKHRADGGRRWRNRSAVRTAFKLLLKRVKAHR